MDNLKARIFRRPLIRRVFELGREGEIYLVGGYLRDLIFSGKHSKDMDFIVRGSVREIAGSVSKALEGTLVELRKEHMLRVCLKDGATTDFSRLAGGIEEDLKRRDFTINAIAWSPETGILDMTGGVADLKKGLIRGISKENFKKDPLRLLRAYRFAGELGFRIEKGTRQIAREIHGALRESAGERITYEFFRLIESEGRQKALRMAQKDGILGEIISLSIGKIERNLKLLMEVDRRVEKIHERFYFKEFSQGLTGAGLLRLESLLYSVPAHRLVLSRGIFSRVDKVNSLLERYKDLGKKAEVTLLYELFSASGDAVSDLLILSGKTDYLKDANRFWDIRKRGLLGTEEIMKATGLKEGRKLGILIEGLRRAQFEGTIRNRQDAIRLVLKIS